MRSGRAIVTSKSVDSKPKSRASKPKEVAKKEASREPSKAKSSRKDTPVEAKDQIVQALLAQIDDLSKRNEELQKTHQELRRENDLLRTHSQLSSFSENIVDVADGIHKALYDLENASINMIIGLPEIFCQTTVPTSHIPLQLGRIPLGDLLAMQNDAYQNKVTLDVFIEKSITHAWVHRIVGIWQSFCPGEWQD